MSTNSQKDKKPEKGKISSKSDNDSNDAKPDDSKNADSDDDKNDKNKSDNDKNDKNSKSNNEDKSDTEQNKNIKFDWTQYLSYVLKQDSENRMGGGTHGKLYTMKNINRKIEWDYALPTLISKKHFECSAKSREAFIRNFYIKNPFLYLFDTTMRKKMKKFNTGYCYSGGSVARNILSDNASKYDIDIYFYNNKFNINDNKERAEAEKDATKLLKRISIELLKAKLKYNHQNRKTVRFTSILNNNAFTLIIKDDAVTIQIIIRLYQNINQILYGFDNGGCSVSFDPHHEAKKRKSNDPKDQDSKKDLNESDNENNSSSDNESTDTEESGDEKPPANKKASHSLQKTSKPLLPKINYKFGELYYTVSSKFTYESGCNIVDVLRLSTTYPLRLEKYRQLGLSIILPYFDTKKLRDKYLKYGMQEICELPHFPFSYNNIESHGNKIHISKSLNPSLDCRLDPHGTFGQNINTGHSDYQIDDLDMHKAFNINLEKVNNDRDDIYYFSEGSYGLNENIKHVVPEKLTISNKMIIDFYESLSKKIAGKNFPHKLFEKYISCIKVHKFAGEYLKIKDLKERDVYMKEIINKQKEISINKISKLRHTNKIKWKLDNPGSQGSQNSLLTASFNPIVMTNAEWYGKYLYVDPSSIEIGKPKDNNDSDSKNNNNNSGNKKQNTDNKSNKSSHQIKNKSSIEKASDVIRTHKPEPNTKPTVSKNNTTHKTQDLKQSSKDHHSNKKSKKTSSDDSSDKKNPLSDSGSTKNTSSEEGSTLPVHQNNSDSDTDTPSDKGIYTKTKVSEQRRNDRVARKRIEKRTKKRLSSD